VKNNTILLIPGKFPLQSILVSSTNATVIGIGAADIDASTCKPNMYEARNDTCDVLQHYTTEKSPYYLSVFSSQHLILQNVTVPSIVACSKSRILIQGNVTGDGLGCQPGYGPGNSSILNGASGGAGHGGKGGNVEPQGKGAGLAYDYPIGQSYKYDMNSEMYWPIWPGSGAASSETVLNSKLQNLATGGGSGGGLMLLDSRELSFESESSLSVKGGYGRMGGGGGSGGSIVLRISELNGKGIIDLSGGDTEQPANLHNKVWDAAILNLRHNEASHGGGGGGGVIKIVYKTAEFSSKLGNGENFVHAGGQILVHGGKSSGQSGNDGFCAAENCSKGRGGLYCLECPPGSYSAGMSSKCVPCEPGHINFLC